jgi:hypothetical protein
MASKSTIANQERARDHDRVAELSYQYFLARGAGDGRDLDDWLEAERFLQQRNAHSMEAELAR